MISKIFVDSSVLIENLKGEKQKLLLQLLSDKNAVLNINETVISEFLFHFLKINGNAAPQSLQSSKKIPLILSQSSDHNLLRLFHFVANDASLIKMVPDLMQRYNILPNDAIILATCKLHGITQLASHDSDFIIPCKEEGIELLREE
jgi:predicted nucleic acid-binding protein